MQVIHLNTTQSCAEYQCLKDAEFKIEFGYFSVVLCSDCTEKLRRRIKGCMSKHQNKLKSVKLKSNYVLTYVIRDIYTAEEDTFIKSFKKKKKLDDFIQHLQETEGKKLVSTEIEDNTNIEDLMSQTMTDLLK